MTTTSRARSTAYREADRRAPPEDKAEIANRLGWLSKETGNTRASSRYFARGRGDGPRVTLTLIIIAITSIVSLTALLSADGEPSSRRSSSTSPPSRQGEYWRLWTVTLLHGDFLHLAFNMYALYLAGTIVERWYGSLRFLAFYLACAAAGSTASFVFGGNVPSVGASGAIFGLFGVLLAAGRVHHPVDRQSRAISASWWSIVVINIAFGFASGGAIDNAAHLGGLAAGLWLGALVPPTGVPTLSSLWHRPGETRSTGTATAPGYVMVLGLAVVGVAVVAGIVVGTNDRSASRRARSTQPVGRGHRGGAATRPERGQAASAVGGGASGGGSSAMTARPGRRPARRRAAGPRPPPRRTGSTVLADGVHQPRPAHPVAHGAAHLRQPELDAGLAQVRMEGGQHVRRRHVQVGGRADVEDDARQAARPGRGRGR